jgi:hypothetical protein
MEIRDNARRIATVQCTRYAIFAPDSSHGLQAEGEPVDMIPMPGSSSVNICFSSPRSAFGASNRPMSNLTFSLGEARLRLSGRL